VGAGSTVDLDRVTAGLHVDLAGGSLVTGQVFRMAFLGTMTARITPSTHLSFGNLELGSANGGTWTIDGRSTITNGSTFTASGGRLEADPFILNGRMTVSKGSTADFLTAPVQGSGTIDP
jgi:hypothetical protein